MRDNVHDVVAVSMIVLRANTYRPDGEGVAARRSVSPCCGTLVDLAIIFAIYAIKILDRVDGVKPVSYTHLTLPTNREV